MATAQPSLNYLPGVPALIPQTKNRGTRCSVCFIPDSLQALSSCQAQSGVSQKHGQDVHPHVGAEKRSPAPRGQCSRGRWASAHCLLRRDSCRRSRTRPRAKGDLNVCRAEHKSCRVIDESTEVCEVKSELQRSPAVLRKSHLSSPRSPYHTTTSIDPSLDALWPSPMRVGAAGEPKLPPSLRVWACLLPFRCCHLHFPGPFSCCILSQCQPPGALSKRLRGNVKKPQTCLPSCFCFTSQTACERTQPCGYASSTVRPGVMARCCEFCHSKPQQASDFRLSSVFNSVFHSSKVVWMEEPMPTLILVWRHHLYVGFCFIATHHPL